MGKCWPFACEGREVEGRSLPPMSLRKFRWWADELESVGVNDEAVKVSFADEDACSTPVRPGGRGKLKVPKKRSIVELFAVAPQIETVEEDDDGEGEEREDLRDGERGEVLERGEANAGFDLVEEVEERNHGGHAVIRRKQIRLKRIKNQKKRKKIITSKKVCDSNSFAVFRIHLPISESGKVEGETGDAVFHILLYNFVVEVVSDSTLLVLQCL